MTSGKVAAGWALGLFGILVAIVSAFGIAVNYEELGAHFCSSPQPAPVCGSIAGFMLELGLFALVGVVMVVAGLYLASAE